MSLEPGRYRFNGSSLARLEIDSDLRLYVADSWLTVDGRTVALERHFARFAASAQAQGLVRPVDDFVDAVRGSIPKDGAWFPRIELTERGELQLSLREAPQRRQSIRLWSASVDPRVEPGIKGPDITALENLREQARTAGADEAVILSANKHVVDGSTTCLLWWRDNRLFSPPAELTRVDSITVSVVGDIARELDTELNEELATPDQLALSEVWAVNALHGIRPVTTWVEGPETVIDENRLILWRDMYNDLRHA